MYIDIGLCEMVLRQQLPVDGGVLRMLGENVLERGQQRIRLAREAFRRGVERDQGPIDEYEGVQACNPQPQVPILKARQALVKTADFFQTAYPDQGRLGGDEVAARQGAPQIAIQPETRQAGPAGELASWGDARSPPGSLRPEIVRVGNTRIRRSTLERPDLGGKFVPAPFVVAVLKSDKAAA